MFKNKVILNILQKQIKYKKYKLPVWAMAI